MVRISIELTEEEAARLRAPTTLLPMRPEALAVATVRDQFNAGDAEFDEFATEIVQKNRELYLLAICMIRLHLAKQRFAAFA